MYANGDIASETERVRKIQDRDAARYDRQIAIPERVLFGDGRRWVCEQAHGDVLELAVGTARNLPFYPRDVNITGIELSEAMLAIGRRRAEQLGRSVDLRLGDAQALEFPTSGSTPWCARCRCARSRTHGGRSPRRGECYGRAGGCSC